MNNQEIFDTICKLARIAKDENQKKPKKLNVFLREQNISVDFIVSGIPPVRFLARNGEYAVAKHLCDVCNADSINLTLGVVEAGNLSDVNKHLHDLSSRIALHFIPHIYAAFSGFILRENFSDLGKCVTYLTGTLLPEKQDLIIFILMASYLASDRAQHAHATYSRYIENKGPLVKKFFLQATTCYLAVTDQEKWTEQDKLLSTISRSEIKSEELLVAALTGFIACDDLRSINQHCPDSYKFLHPEILLTFTETYATRLRFHKDQTILKTITLLYNPTLREVLLTLIPKERRDDMQKHSNALRQNMDRYKCDYDKAKKIESFSTEVLREVGLFLKIGEKKSLSLKILAHISSFFDEYHFICTFIQTELVKDGKTTHYYLNNSFFTQKITPVAQKIQKQFSCALFYREKATSRATSPDFLDKITSLFTQYNPSRAEISAAFSKEEYELLFRLVVANGDVENMKWLMETLTNAEMDINAQSSSSGKSALHFLIIKANEFPEKKRDYDQCLDLLMNKALLTFDKENKTPKDYDTHRLYTSLFTAVYDDAGPSSVSTSNARST